MSAEISLRVGGVFLVQDGVVIGLVFEKMRVPVAEDPLSDEAKVFKKMMSGVKAMGFQIDLSQMPCASPNNPRQFHTELWFSTEDYEKMGKPTVNDVLSISIKKFIEPETVVCKPATPYKKKDKKTEA